jgi:hypothetical protein
MSNITFGLEGSDLKPYLTSAFSLSCSRSSESCRTGWHTGIQLADLSDIRFINDSAGISGREYMNQAQKQLMI